MVRLEKLTPQEHGAMAHGDIPGTGKVSKAAVLKGKPGVAQAEFWGYRLAVSAVDSRDTYSVGGVVKEEVTLL